MSVKLFVTDLDGTLVSTGNQVSAKNIQAAQDAAAAGVTVAIATGRMFPAALPVSHSLGMDLPIISYNGALLRAASGKVLHTDFIPDEIALEVMDFILEKGWYLQLYSKDELYFAEETEEAAFYQRSQAFFGKAVGRESLKDYCTEVPKLLTITSGQSESEERIAEIRERFSGKVQALQSCPRYVEIVRPGVSKAAAIRILAAKLGCNMSEVMAIGDAQNDLPMLMVAGRSIAMGNAVSEVKSVCDYETGRCEEDGWADAVYRYVLEGKI